MFKDIKNFFLGDPIDRVIEALSIGKAAPLHKYLASGGDPNASRGGYGPDKSCRMSLIRQAAITSQVREVELLLDMGADPNGGYNSITGTTLLHDLADSTDEQNARVVRKALEMGMNPDGSDKAPSTPLYIAASRGNKAVVAVLLEFGADPNRTNWGGVTPLEVLGEFRDGMRFIKVIR